MKKAVLFYYETSMVMMILTHTFNETKLQIAMMACLRFVGHNS